jgi:hypothetical protein
LDDVAVPAGDLGPVFADVKSRQLRIQVLWTNVNVDFRQRWTAVAGRVSLACVSGSAALRRRLGKSRSGTERPSSYTKRNERGLIMMIAIATPAQQVFRARGVDENDLESTLRHEAAVTTTAA